MSHFRRHELETISICLGFEFTIEKIFEVTSESNALAVYKKQQ